MSSGDTAGMPPKHLFSIFDVSKQVFYRSPLSIGIVNLKPLISGHVLVLPHRVVPRLQDLNAQEVCDLFISVQEIGRAVERAYGAQALTVSIQDGKAAGQSVPHVHVHLLPRKATDFNGDNDQVYPAVEANEASLASLHRTESTNAERNAWDIPKDEDRKPRSDLEMGKEASWLASLFPPDRRP